MVYTADFETTTNPDDCRVWAYGIVNVDTLDFNYGNDIEDFIDWCKWHDNPTLYFHNLKFDASFILNFLLSNKYYWCEDNNLRYTYETNKIDGGNGVFTTLIDGTGKFYQICVYFKIEGKKTQKVTFYNSLNVLPFSVDKIAKAFGLPLSKLKIDYDLYRRPGHKLTDLEIEYLKADCEIVARALRILFDQGLDKMTQASNGLHDLKMTIGKKRFEKLLPIIKDDSTDTVEKKYRVDAEIRQSYKGGYCYLKPEFVNKIIEQPGIVLDVNSLYPSVMRNKLLPYGIPVAFDGLYKYDEDYPLFVQGFTCQFKLREGFLPTIQLKNDNRFVGNEYLTSSNDEQIYLCLTSLDLELFFKHYIVYDIEYRAGYKFKAAVGIFADYVDKWTKVKTEAKQSNNDGMYTLAKLMLNAPYGRIALNPKVSSKSPYLDNGILKFSQLPTEYRDPLHIPCGSFITAWARYIEISAGQANYDRVIYFDTDSLFLLGDTLPDNLVIDDTKLGAWSHEFTFTKSIFLRQKTYYLEGYEPDKPNVKKSKIACAGLPTKARKMEDDDGIPKIRKNKHGSYNFVDFDNFRYDSTFSGALKPKQVKGGCVLEPIEWEIKRLKH